MLKFLITGKKKKKKAQKKPKNKKKKKKKVWLRQEMNPQLELVVLQLFPAFSLQQYLQCAVKNEQKQIWICSEFPDDVRLILPKSRPKAGEVYL